MGTHLFPNVSYFESNWRQFWCKIFLALVALEICPRVALVALRTYHLLDHLSCNDCCPIPRCPCICICIGICICIFWQHCLCSNAASARSSVLPCCPIFTHHCPQLKSLFNPVRSWWIFFSLFALFTIQNSIQAFENFIRFNAFQPLHTYALWTVPAFIRVVNWICVRQLHFSCHK